MAIRQLLLHNSVPILVGQFKNRCGILGIFIYSD